MCVMAAQALSLVFSPKDVVQYPVSLLFAPKPSPQRSYTASRGSVVTRNSAVARLDFGQLSGPSHLQFIDNQSFVGLFNENGVGVVFNLDLDGLTFLSNTTIDMGGQIGEGYRCSSSAVDQTEGVLVVVCHRVEPESGQSSLKLVYSYSRGAQLKANVTTVLLDPSRKMRDPVVAVVVTPTPGASPRVLVYSDGYSGEEEAGWVGMFEKTQATGEYEFTGYLSVGPSGGEGGRFLNLYMWSAEERAESSAMAVVMMRGGDGGIGYYTCEISNSKEMVCDADVRSTGFGKDAWMGVIGRETVLVYEANEGLVSLCGMDVSARKILTEGCEMFGQLKVQQGASVRWAEGNAEQVVLRLLSTDASASYLGAARLVRRFNESYILEDREARIVPINSQLYMVSANKVLVTRIMDDSLLLVVAKDLEEGENQVDITIYEPDGSGQDATTTVSINITRLKTQYDGISFNSSYYLYLQAYTQQEDFEIPLSPGFFTGNDLMFDFKADPSSVISTTLSSNKMASVLFNHSVGSSVVVELALSNYNEAIVLDSEGVLSYDLCGFDDQPSSYTITCSQLSHVQLSSDFFSLKRWIQHELGCAIAWGESYSETGTQTTVIFIFQDSASSSSPPITFQVEKVTSSIAVFSQGAVLFFVLSHDSNLSVYSIDLSSQAQTLSFHQYITKETLSLEYLCPRSVSVVPPRPSSRDGPFFDVFSYCPFQDQRVVRVASSNMTVVSQVAMNLNSSPSLTCSFSDEILVAGSRSGFYLYLTDVDQSLSMFSFEGLGFDLEDIQSLTCMPEVNAAVVGILDSDTLDTVLLMVEGGKKYSANGRVFTSVYKVNDTSSGYAQSYSVFGGDFVHWFKGKGNQNTFVVSLREHRKLFANFKDSKRGGNASIQMQLSNQQSSSAQTLNISLIHAFTEIVVGKEKTFKNIPGVHKLSDFLNITGHVFEMNLTKAVSSSSNFILSGRIQLESVYNIEMKTSEVSNRIVKVNNLTMGVSWRNSATGTTFIQFVLQTGGETVQKLGEEIILEKTWLLDFDFMFVLDNRTLLVYSDESRFETVVALTNITTGQTLDSVTLLGRSSKLQVVHMDAMDTFLVFAHCDRSMLLSVFFVDVGAGITEIDLRRQYPGVIQFSPLFFHEVGMYQIYCIQQDSRYKVFIKTVILDGTPNLVTQTRLSKEETVEGSLEVDYPNVMLTAISCGMQNITHYYCVVNFYTTYLTEFVSSVSSQIEGVRRKYYKKEEREEGLKDLAYSVYRKYPGMDGVRLQSSCNYILLTVGDPEEGYRDVVWRRKHLGGDEFVYWVVSAGNNRTLLDQKHTYSPPRIVQPEEHLGVRVKEGVLAPEILVQVRSLNESGESLDYIYVSNPFVSVRYAVKNLVQFRSELPSGSQFLLIVIITVGSIALVVTVFLYFRAVRRELKKKKEEEKEREDKKKEEEEEDKVGVGSLTEHLGSRKDSCDPWHTLSSKSKTIQDL